MMHLRPLVALVALLFAASCERQEYRGPTDYAVPLRTPAQLRSAITAQCNAARAARLPLLLEFSARWCTDCRTLATMKKGGPLAAALAQKVKLVEVNVGDFERHKDLIALYDVDRIATWVMLRPTDCAAPIEKWPKLASRSVEPLSGGAKVGELIAWLGGK